MKPAINQIVLTHSEAKRLQSALTCALPQGEATVILEHGQLRVVVVGSQAEAQPPHTPIDDL